MTRRRLLLVVCAGGIIAGAGLAARRSLRRRRPRLPDASVAPMDAVTADAITALPEALVDRPLERARYEDFYRFRAENVPGYHTLYAHFAAAADSKSEALFSKRFSDATYAERRAVLDELHQPRDRRVRVRPLFDPWPGRYQRFLIRETLALYDDTDAWLELGYGAWPGMPRTIAFMQVPPADLRKQAR